MCYSVAFMKYRKSNTEALQQRHRKVYEDFFAQNDVALSSGQGYSMVTGLSWRVGAPAIYHKLPFRCYIGVAKGKKRGKIYPGTVFYYSARLDKFLPSEDAVTWDVVLPQIKRMLTKELGENFEGITLSVLMERPEDRGTDNAISQTMAAACYLYHGVVSPKQLSELPSLSSAEIQEQKTPAAKLFRKIHREGVKLTSLEQTGTAAGSGGFAHLLDSELPVVHVTEERAGSIKAPYGDGSLPPIDVKGDVDQVDNLKSWGFRLNEMADVRGDFPLEVVSIFPGSARVMFSASEYTATTLLPSFDTLRDDAKDLFSSVDTKSDKRLPPFLKYLDQDGRYWQEYARGQVYVRLYFLRALVNLYKNKWSSAFRADFLEAVKSMFSLNAPFEETPSVNLQKIVRALRDKANKKRVSIAIRTYSWGKQDGNILIYFPPKKFRAAVEEVVEDMRKEVDDAVHIDFSSRYDGWGKKGLRVEQAISHKVFSGFTNKNAKRVTVYTKAGSKAKIAERVSNKKYDVVVNKVDDKIYIAGQECSSKELPSQKATVEILSALLDHEGKAVSNIDLPKNSYTSYRNELQGKIITPLVKLVKQRTGKELDLHIEGKLMNFNVSLDIDGLKIAHIDKIS